MAAASLRQLCTRAQSSRKLIYFNLETLDGLFIVEHNVSVSAARAASTGAKYAANADVSKWAEPNGPHVKTEIPGPKSKQQIAALGKIQV